MFRLLALILLFFSFSSYSAYHKVLSDSSGQLVGQYCIGDSLGSCYSLFPDENNGATGASYSISVKGTNLWEISRRYAQYNYIFIQVTKFSTCSTSASCFPIAQSQCSLSGQVIASYEFISADVFNYTCKDEVSPAQECENLVTEQCVNNFGFSSSSLSDDGLGGSVCSGVCGDGSIPDDTPNPVCDLSNNYCDVPKPDSALDFGSGGTGSSVAPSTTTVEDEEYDVEYTPDGSTSDSSTDMSSLQGDKLINEVIATRNDNTKNLASTTETTNQTIVEKSDDISETVSNSANGIIDAVNNMTPFYDGNIVEAIDGLGDKIDDLGSGLEYISPNLEGFSNTMFGEVFIQTYNRKTVDLKAEIQQENLDFKDHLKANINFSSHANGYQANTLDAGKWGSFDISLSRFSDYFGGLGNIIYFLASITALTIVLGGVRF